MNKIKILVVLVLSSISMNIQAQDTITITNDNFKAYLESGRQYFKEYRYKQALSIFEKLHNYDTTNIQVTNQLAELYSGLNSKNKALYYLNKTLSVDSLNLFALITSGDIYLRSADPGIAQAFYMRVIEMVDSGNYYAHRQMGTSYYSMGPNFYPVAVTFFGKAVKYNPYDVYSISRMGNIYNVTNQYHLADSICSLGLRYDPSNSMLLNIKAYAMFNMKRYLDAVNNFEIVFQKEDTTEFNLKYTGLSYFNLNDFDKAQFFLERSIVYDSTDYDCFTMLSRIYLQKNELDKGLACITRAEKINYPPPFKWSEIFKTMADIYNQKNEWDKAIECFQKGYALNPNDKTLMCKLAYQYDFLKQREKAIELYTQVIEKADPEEYVTEIKIARERLEKLKMVRKK